MKTTCDVEERTNVSLGDIIDVCSHGGLDAFLDMLAERIGHPLLTDIDYRVESVNEDGSLRLKVTGCREVDECDECGNIIPDDTPSIVNEHHKDSCSLHPKNEAKHGEVDSPAP